MAVPLYDISMGSVGDILKSAWKDEVLRFDETRECFTFRGKTVSVKGTQAAPLFTLMLDGQLKTAAYLYGVLKPFLKAACMGDPAKLLMKSRSYVNSKICYLRKAFQALGISLEIRAIRSKDTPTLYHLHNPGIKIVVVGAPMSFYQEQALEIAGELWAQGAFQECRDHLSKIIGSRETDWGNRHFTSIFRNNALLLNCLCALSQGCIDEARDDLQEIRFEMLGDAARSLLISTSTLWTGPAIGGSFITGLQTEENCKMDSTEQQQITFIERRWRLPALILDETKRMVYYNGRTVVLKHRTSELLALLMDGLPHQVTELYLQVFPDGSRHAISRCALNAKARNYTLSKCYYLAESLKKAGVPVRIERIKRGARTVEICLKCNLEITFGIIGPPPSPREEAALNMAKGLFEQGDYEACLDHLDDAIMEGLRDEDVDDRCMSNAANTACLYSFLCAKALDRKNESLRYLSKVRVAMLGDEERVLLKRNTLKAMPQPPGSPKPTIKNTLDNKATHG